MVSCVVAHDGTEVAAGDIRAFLSERWASYKVPRTVLFVHDDEIALTGNAKIKSAELRKLAAERLQGAGYSGLSNGRRSSRRSNRCQM